MANLAGKKKHKILKFSNHQLLDIIDEIVIESPLTIELYDSSSLTNEPFSFTMTMRTPGEDGLLAIGYLFAENIIESSNDLTLINQINADTVRIGLSNFKRVDWALHSRQGLTSSSCGVCGKLSLDNYKVCTHLVDENKITLEKNVLCTLPKKLRVDQSLFIETGGIHAAALFSKDGNLLSFKEDVGRHNAMDKLIGHCISNHCRDIEEKILLLSGRSSFELLQKAARLGVKLVCSIGAPSTSAIEIADVNGIILIGFLKENSFNIYTHHEKVIFK
jgi:FdhD protein